MQRHAHLAGEGRVITGAEGLHVLLRRGLHQHVHVDAGQAHQAGVQGAVFHNALHLDDDRSAGIPGGLCLGQGLGVYALPLEGAVAPGIGIAGPENGHLNGDGRVEQLFLPLQLNELYHVPGRPGGVVELAPLQAGVYKGAQAHMGNYAGLSRGNVPEKLGDHPLGQVVAGQLVFRAQPAQLGGEPPVAADHPAAKALHPQVVQAAAVAVALTGGVQGGQAVGPLAVSRPLLQRSENGLRMHQAAGEAAEGDGVSVVDVLAHGIVRRQDFGHICTPFPLTIPPRKEAARVRLVCGPRRCRKYTA